MTYHILNSSLEIVEYITQEQFENETHYLKEHIQDYVETFGEFILTREKIYLVKK